MFFARELLEEISEISKKVDIELETFVHGAMYSHSGICLFAFMTNAMQILGIVPILAGGSMLLWKRCGLVNIFLFLKMIMEHIF